MGKYSELFNGFIAKNSIKDTEGNNKFTLTAGRYIAEIDIPCGCYNLKILDGTGIISAERPHQFFVRLESNPQIRKERNWSDEYRGFDISKETVLEISENAKVEFTYFREFIDTSSKDNYNSDEDIKKETKELEEEITRLNNLLEKHREEIENLKSQNRESEKEVNRITQKFYKKEKEFENEIRTKQKNFSDVLNEKGEIIHELEDLKLELQESDIKIKQKDSEIFRLREEIEIMKERIETEERLNKTHWNKI